MKKFNLALVILALCLPAAGQYSVWAVPIISQTGQPIVGAAVAVCNLPTPSLTVPCGGTTPATIYAGFSGGTQTQPLFTDSNGLAPIFTVPGNYFIQVYGPNIQTTIIPITVGGGSGGGGSSIWSDLLSPNQSLKLSMGMFVTTFLYGDFGSAPGMGGLVITDTSTSTTDNTPDFNVTVPPTSYHNAGIFNVGGFAQFQICNTFGSQHVGITVTGSALPCPSLSNSPVSKQWNLVQTNAHTATTDYELPTGYTGNLHQFHAATAAGTGFNFWTACPGASTLDGSCPSANIVALLRGDGFLNAQSMGIGPIASLPTACGAAPDCIAFNNGTGTVIPTSGQNTIRSGTSGYAVSINGSPEYLLNNSEITPDPDTCGAIDNCISTVIGLMASGTSAVIDMGVFKGNFTATTNPWASQLVQAYAPTTSGVVRFCGANITSSQSWVVPGGWILQGCGIGFAGSSLGFTLKYNGPATTAMLCTNGAAAGTPLEFTITCASGLTANMANGMVGACTSSTTQGLSCASATLGNSAWGNILSVNVGAQTAVVLAPNTAGGTANGSNTTFIYFGCTVCLASTAAPTGGGNQQFKAGVEFASLDSGGVSGAVPLYSANCSNLCWAHDLTLLPSDNAAMLFDSSSVQNSGDVFNFWVVGASLRSGTAGTHAVGLINRMVGSSSMFNIHSGSIALTGANSGAGVLNSMIIDTQGHYSDIHILTSTQGEAVSAGQCVQPPVIVFSACGTINGAEFDQVNISGASGTNTAVGIHIGTNASPTGWTVSHEKVGTFASANPIFQDDNYNSGTGCSLTKSQASTLESYGYDQGGGFHSSSATSCSGLAVQGQASAYWHLSNQGTACGAGNFVLGAGWGSTSTVTSVSGFSQTCQFKITSGSGSFSASPTFTYTFPNSLSITPVCTADVYNVTGAGGAIIFFNNVASATAPQFTATTTTGGAFTPAASETYTAVIRCGP